LRAWCGLLALVFVLFGCGPQAGLWVRVEAPLRVPSEADGLRLTARRASGAVAFDQRWDLTEVGAFPQTLALYQEDDPGGVEEVLELEVQVFLGDALAAPWSQARVNASLRRDRVEEVVVRLCDCEAGP